MKKNILFTFLIAGLISCKSNKISTSNDVNSNVTIIQKFSNTINVKDAKKHLYTLASDEYEGRRTSEKGQKMAAEYLSKQYKKFGIKGIEGTQNYFQIVPIEALINKRRKFEPTNASENVLAFIEGSEKPEEIIIISSHYDHEGIKKGEIYPGADDNASGTTGVLEIAQAFAKAKKAGYGPKRSILFMNFTGEEKGLLGSKYYVANPTYPLKNIVAALNIDMIGRVNKEHENNPNYVYVIGADRLSTELHTINETANKSSVNLDLDYTYNKDSDPNRFYFRSDHYNFAKNGIPIIFYFNGVHEDYHKPTDTADKINYELLVKRAQLVFSTAWELANRTDRLIVDINDDSSSN
jgi:Zn-dependent M28 family amino/carboxypeptidase